MNKLITKDVADIIQAKYNRYHPDITPIDTTQFFQIYVGGIKLVKKPSGVESHMTELVTSEYFREWKKDVGALVAKDLKNQETHLFEMKFENYKVILLEVDNDKESGKKSRIQYISIGSILTQKRTFAIVRICESDEYISNISGNSWCELMSHNNTKEFEELLSEENAELENKEEIESTKYTPPLF